MRRPATTLAVVVIALGAAVVWDSPGRAGTFNGDTALPDEVVVIDVAKQKATGLVLQARNSADGLAEIMCTATHFADGAVTGSCAAIAADGEIASCSFTPTGDALTRGSPSGGRGPPGPPEGQRPEDRLARAVAGINHASILTFTWEAGLCTSISVKNGSYW